jgi:glycosyltransferase involved in cell wall biosynthesis
VQVSNGRCERADRRKLASSASSGGGNVPELEELARQFPGRVIILDGRSEDVAKEIHAAGDFFLLPSRFEPCGLTDFRAQLNGNSPIANQVGGLSKTVNGKTGIGFFGLGDRAVLRGLVDGMLRALDLSENPDLTSLLQHERTRTSAVLIRGRRFPCVSSAIRSAYRVDGNLRRGRLMRHVSGAATDRARARLR